MWKARIVQKILGKSSDDSLLLKDFFGPQSPASHFGGLLLVEHCLHVSSFSSVNVDDEHKAKKHPVRSVHRTWFTTAARPGRLSLFHASLLAAHKTRSCTRLQGKLLS